MSEIEKVSFLDRVKREIQPTLRDYFKIVFRRKYMILIPTIIITVLGIVYSLILPKQYMAKSIILIEDKKLLKAAFKRIILDTALTEKLNMIRTEMLSWNNLYEVIQKLGMDIEEQAKTPLEMEYLIKRIQDATDIRLTGFAGGVTVLQVSYTGLYPETVQKYVNSVTQRYIEKQLVRQNRDTNEAIEFIKKEVDNYREKIEKNDKEALDFDDTNLYYFAGLPSQGPGKELSHSDFLTMIFLTQGYGQSQLQQALAQYELELQAQLQKLKRINDQISGEKEFVVSESTKELNPTAAALQNQIQNYETQLEMMRLKYREEHPEIKRFNELLRLAQERMASLDKEIKTQGKSGKNPMYQALLKQKQAVEIDIDTYRARRDSVVKLISEGEKRSRQTRMLQAERGIMTRDYGIAENVYSELRTQLENTRITKKLDNLQKGVRFEVLESARLPLKPVSPNKPKIWLIALCLGLACGVGLLMVMEFADHSLRGPEDVYRYLDIPLLSVIPNLVTQDEMRYYHRKLKISAALFIVLLTSAGILIFVFQTPIIQILGALK